MAKEEWVLGEPENTQTIYEWVLGEPAVSIDGTVVEEGNAGIMTTNTGYWGPTF